MYVCTYHMIKYENADSEAGPSSLLPISTKGVVKSKKEELIQPN